MNKVVLVDFSVYVHKSIILYGMNDKKRLEAKLEETPIPATWTCMNILLADLAKLDLEPDDLIIIAQDAFNNWRKVLDPVYKANRKQNREKQSHIDWGMWWPKFDRLVENIHQNTHFFPIKIDTLEADDIISASCRYFKDANEIIIVSVDSDYEMLTCFKNVKLFNQKTKEYKKVTKDPYAILESKMNKEVSDNLKTKAVTPEEIKIRKAIVNLMELPEVVENKVIAELDKLKQCDYTKKCNIDNFMFKSLIKKIPNIYNKPLEEKEEAYKKLCKKSKVNVAAGSNELF